jgi:uncharacterized protein DUF1376
MADLPDPLIAPDVDLRDFKTMPLYVHKLRRSEAWKLAKAQPELGFYMVNLWASAWHEVPCGSIEDDDDLLALLAMCNRRRWPKVRELSLHGWVRCSDGKFYHPTIVDIALQAWQKRQNLRRDGAAGARARWGNHGYGPANGQANG